MTTITAPTTSTTNPATRLRLVLRLNAATSFVAGAAGLLLADRIADGFGLGSAGWTRLVGAGLMVFAIEVALGSRRRLATTALVTSILDLAWVAGTVAVLAAGDLTGTGQVVAVVMGIGVLDFALLQLWYRSRLER